MENKDDESCYQHCSNTENEQRGCEDDAIDGETNEEPEYDTQEASSDTQVPSDDEHGDSSLEGLCILDGKKQAGGENIPVLGMSFESDQDAYDYYNSYARVVGFSVRRLRSNKYKHTNVTWKREFCCSCEGFYTKKNTPEKKREERRFGCKAMLQIKLNEDGKFVVTKFEAEHTHDLVPESSSHVLRSQRTIEPSQGGLMNQMHFAGFKPSQIFSYLTVEAGGPENLNFLQTDCNNFIQRRRAKFLKKGDAQCLLDYFKKKQMEDKSFFYAIRTNIDNEICGCFFCDGKSRSDYTIFGDVVVFDTTFKTNKYDMVCAPIVGVNHHGQTILFGCGLLDGETTEACKWFFDVFLQAMGGKKPKTIFTDQAASIASAIREVLPNSHHRLCLWHIYQNAAKHLSQVFTKFSTFSQAFKSCIYDPESVEEFESSWKDLLDYYDLKENEWLKDLYNLREKWAQIYGRCNFCAGMTTTQRSESINKTLKKFFYKNLILCEWVVHYERALVDRREKERLAEVATTQRKRKLLSNWKVEVEAAKMYTKASFNCFQEEFRKCLDLILELESDDGRIETYVVQRPGNPNLRRSVIYSPSNQSVNCSCKRFQFEGILCAHALKLFRELGLSTLPSKYYLKRWRRDARQGVDLECYGEANFSDRSASSALQYSHLSHIAQRIVAKGAKDKQSSTLVESKLLELEAELDGNLSIGQEHETNGDIDSNDQVNENNANLVLRDPKVKRGRRRGKGKRNNDLGSKKQSKLRSSSVRREQEDGPVPLKEQNVSVSRKRKTPSKRKDSQEPNSYEHEKTGPSNSYEHVQGSIGLVNQNQSNMPFINPGFPTTFGPQGIPSHYPYGFPPTTSSVQAMPNQSHDIPSHYPYGFPPTASIVHAIPSQSLGYQPIRPMFDYSLMYSQAIIQPRPQGPAHQLNFPDPSTS
ncbi:protein FAR1-RELATED SEQUENCE 5 isoform X3 [Rosa chinensis]|nr:protein FAR1-RELATED SEQUENCE 5 isoform X3 [Rosa chinensis]XP_040365772.1 protein FAR1-RELATED SEQUENCE 5 isoform X3 [Rosa chinensis]XP_040365774.1 protein FAR1-RELATED SEQUENCE 5 isoform X3 [Rosa chinensis]